MDWKTGGINCNVQRKGGGGRGEKCENPLWGALPRGGGKGCTELPRRCHRGDTERKFGTKI